MILSLSKCLRPCSFEIIAEIVQAITQIFIGGAITVTGIFNPYLIGGPVIAAVGAGILMLLDQHTGTGKWVGFQIVLGIGVGFCLTIPLMLSSVVVKAKDVSIATPFIICKFQTRWAS